MYAAAAVVTVDTNKWASMLCSCCAILVTIPQAQSCRTSSFGWMLTAMVSLTMMSLSHWCEENGNATVLTTHSLTLHSLPPSHQIVIRSRHKHTEQQLIDAFKVALTLCLELCSFDSRYPVLQMFDDSGTGFLSIKRLQHAMKHLIDMDETRVRGTKSAKHTHHTLQLTPTHAHTAQ